jgi:hypothetical protein
MIGVSIYEDDHPNLTEVINCTLVHCATWKNEEPKKISDTIVIPKDFDNKVNYAYTCCTGYEW